MRIPQGISFLNDQELMELIIQAEKLLVMLKAADPVPSVCVPGLFSNRPPFKSKPPNELTFKCNQHTLLACSMKFINKTAAERTAYF